MAVVVFVAAVDNEDAVEVVVVDDVCTVDELIDCVTVGLSLAGFGELATFWLSTLRGLALVVAAVNAVIAEADAVLFVFGSFALAFPDGATVFVVVLALGVADWLLAVFSLDLDMLAITSFSSLIMVMLLLDELPFGTLYDNVLIAAKGFGGGCNVTCGDVCIPFSDVVVDAVLPIDIIVTVGRFFIGVCCCWLATVC